MSHLFRFQVALEVLSYHSMCTDEEMRELNKIRSSELPSIDRQVFGSLEELWAASILNVLGSILSVVREIFQLT